MAADYLLSATEPLTLSTIEHLLVSNARVVLGADTRQHLAAGHTAWPEQPGQDKLLPPHNMVLAHANGAGAEVPAEVVRLMLLLKAQSLSRGYAGVSPALVQRLLDFYNREVLPVVYQQGATGEYGDSGALAHLSLPLVGLGEVNYQGYRLQAADVLELFGWPPLTLAATEAQFLLSGTQFTLAYAVQGLVRTGHLLAAADTIGALALEAFGGSTAPFAARLHELRPRSGQATVAARLRSLLAHSELQAQFPQVETVPYSFRCLPQVHGASRDALTYVRQVVEAECQAVTETPTFFADDASALSGGNFHGQPLALALHMLAVATAELGSISGRRTAQLLSGPRGLPSHLAAGLAGVSHTAMGLISQNQQFCGPVSFAGQLPNNNLADHVSLSANIAVNARGVVENVTQLLGLELLTAAQVLALRCPARTSPELEQLVANFREKVAPIAPGQTQYPALHAAADFVRNYAWA